MASEERTLFFSLSCSMRIVTEAEQFYLPVLERRCVYIGFLSRNNYNTQRIPRTHEISRKAKYRNHHGLFSHIKATRSASSAFVNKKGFRLNIASDRL